MTVLKNTIGAIVGFISFFVLSLLIPVGILWLGNILSLLPNFIEVFLYEITKWFWESDALSIIVNVAPFLISHWLCDLLCERNSSSIKVGNIVFDVITLLFMAIVFIVSLIADFKLYSLFIYIIAFVFMIYVVREDFT